MEKIKNKLNILVVDQDIEHRRSLVLQLGSSHLNLVPAESVVDAARLAKLFRIDVVIVDASLLKELGEALHLRGQEIPLICMDSNSGVDNIGQVALVHVPKPVHLIDLLLAVKKVIKTEEVA